MVQVATKPKRAERPEAPDGAKLSQLIAAAEDIFLAKGYHTATMSDVAKAAGMSKKTVYQLIESKAELFVALLAHQQSLLTFPKEQPDWSTSDILVQHLLCLARFVLAPQQIAIVRLVMAEYTHSPDFGRAFHQKRLTKARHQLEDCLVQIAQRQGVVLRDPREMAAMLFGMALGEFHIGTLLGFRSAPGRVVLERRIRHAVELFLSGCEQLARTDCESHSCTIPVDRKSR
jgi:AcrR family transcriptional regulator